MIDAASAFAAVISCSALFAAWASFSSASSDARNPAAMASWRSRIAARSGGQINFMQNHTKKIKVTIWPIKVALKFIANLC